MLPIATLPLAVVGFGLTQSVGDIIVSGALRDSEMLARGLASEVEQFVRLHGAAATAVAAEASNQPFTTQHLTRLILRCRESYPALVSMAIVDPRGRVVASDPPVTSNGKPTTDVDVSSQRWFQEVSRTHRPFIEEQPLIGWITSTPVVTVNAPIVDGAGRLLGVVSGGLGLGHVQTLADRIQLGRTGYAQLASAKGIAVAHRDRSLVDQGYDFSKLPIWREVTSAATGQVPRYTGALGDRRLAGYATVHGPGWKVWVNQSLDEIEGQVRATYRPMVIWTALALVGACALVVALATMISQPIQALRETARSLGAGDFKQRALESGPREVRELAGAFNQMVDALAQHEHDMAETSIFLNSVLESATEYSIIATGLDGTILSWNEGARRMFGWEAADVVGRASITFEPEDVRAGRAAEVLTAAREYGKWEGEMRQVRADGTRFAAHLTITLRRNAEGAPIGLTTIARDLTAWHRIERDLRRGELRFRQLLESGPDAMVIVDAQGRIVLVNAQAERTFGYARADLLNKPVEMLIPDRFRARHGGHRAGYLTNPIARPMGRGLELWGRRSDGTEFPIEISLSPMETEAGVLVSSAIRDITEQRALRGQLQRKNEELEEQYQRLQEANRLKSEFLANMSHELRTPLNGIIGFAELMHDGKVGPVAPDHKEFLGDILTSARHLLQLINDVLDLAKVESGKMEFRPEPVQIGAVIGEVCDTLRTLTAQKRIDVVRMVDPLVSTVVTDAGKLKQILYNYVSNALKFTPDQGRVSVRVTVEDSRHFRIEVEDTGVGIRPEDVPKLFTEFQQLDSSAAKMHQGTGLGLALTRRIAEAQGGRVGVRSTPGVGSVFVAVLPREAAVTLAPALPSQRTRPRDGAPTILVVDDDPSSLKLADRALYQVGYRVVCRSSTETALRAAAEEPPAAVVMDLVMPPPDGFELLKRLRETRAGARTPVLVWTVKELSREERAQLDALAHAIVPKGDGAAALIETLLQHVPISAATRSTAHAG
jgi:PAS domain S-box-containing protein